MKQQTLDTKNVDGFQIITGFQERVIDPAATRAKNGGTIYELQENQEILNKIKVQNRYRADANLAEKKSIAALMRNENKDGKIGNKETDKIKRQVNLAEIGRQDKIRADLFGSIGVINEELKVLNLSYQEKAKSILRENPVYNDEVEDAGGNKAGPREGEVILPDEEITTLKEKFLAKKKTEQVLVKGDIIPDFRGKVFHYKDSEMTGNKWTSGIVESLGDGLDLGIFVEDLTPEQVKEIQEQSETERISGMTTVEKEDEFVLQDDSILSQAAVMKNKLEIQGDPDALTKSQEFYNVELTKLKLKYGVE